MEPKFFTVIQGSTRTLPLRVLGARTRDPLDITLASEIRAIFHSNDDDTPLLVKTMTNAGGVVILNGPGGRLAVTLSPADTAALLPMDRGSFEVEVTVGGVVNISEATNRLTVIPRLA